MLDLEFTQLSDPGRTREQNEDYLGYLLPATPAQARAHGWLFALADGVGGQEQGEVAARIAVETLLSGFRESSVREPHAALLPRLVQTANARVVDAGLASGAAIATTLVACALRFDRVVVAHVGDSRCYLIRRNRATALTRDHTLVDEQARMGLISAEDAAHAATRHVLSRSLGSGLFVAADVAENQVAAGDVLLLCSDGLHGSVTAQEMARAVSETDTLVGAAEKLLELANQRDGSDNISVQLIRVRSVERMGMYRGRPYKLR